MARRWSLRPEEPHFAGPSSPSCGLNGSCFHGRRVPSNGQIHFGGGSAQTHSLDLVGPAGASLDERRRLPFSGGSIVFRRTSHPSLFDRGLLWSMGAARFSQIKGKPKLAGAQIMPPARRLREYSKCHYKRAPPRLYELGIFGAPTPPLAHLCYVVTINRTATKILARSGKNK